MRPNAPKSSVKTAVVKGWNLIGNPYHSDLPVTNLSLEYKDGAVRSFDDAATRREIAGYLWSYEGSANPKQYYFISNTPDKYKTTPISKPSSDHFEAFGWLLKVIKFRV